MPCGYQVRRTKRRESSLARGSNSNDHQGQLKTGKGVEWVEGVVVIVTKEKGTTAAAINNSPHPTTLYIESKTLPPHCKLLFHNKRTTQRVDVYLKHNNTLICIQIVL